MFVQKLWSAILLLVLIVPSLGLPSVSSRSHIELSRTYTHGRTPQSLCLVTSRLRERRERQCIYSQRWNELDCMHGLRGGGVVKATHDVLLKFPLFWLPWHRFPILVTCLLTTG